MLKDFKFQSDSINTGTIRGFPTIILPLNSNLILLIQMNQDQLNQLQSTLNSNLILLILDAVL